MPDEKKLDPFKPAEPNIPGVSPGEETRRGVRARIGKLKLSAIPPLAWIIAAAAGVVIVGGGLALHSIRAGSSMTAVSHAAPLAAPAAAKPATPKEILPSGPGVIATAQELKQTWSAKRFLFPDSVTGETDPAMVVRLPHGDYWGFSLREPFGKCELEYVTNLELLRRNYQFSADHPCWSVPAIRPFTTCCAMDPLAPGWCEETSCKGPESGRRWLSKFASTAMKSLPFAWNKNLLLRTI